MRRVGIAADHVRASLIHDVYSAHRDVEDDDMNLIALGGRVIDEQLAWELARTFIGARFRGEECHRRRRAEVQRLEARPKEYPS